MLNLRKWREKIREWLDEDLMEGDLSTESLFPEEKEGEAWIVAKESGIVAGLPFAKMVFEELDLNLSILQSVRDGMKVERGDVLLHIKGPYAILLAGERLALNILQHLSGIATLTNLYVQQVDGYPVRIVDTRKTLPGLRGLEKYAVRQGGGHNHRSGLYDAAMMKDNHIKAAGGILEAVTRLRNALPHTVKIEVEVEDLEQVEEAIRAKADIIMLDNMSVEMMKEAVRMITSQHTAIIEASGGVNLQTVRTIAETGVHVISVGALTHSVKALDISMDVGERKRLI